MASTKLYSLRKSRQIMKTAYAWYKKKGSTLNGDQKVQLEKLLSDLDQALLNQDRQTASAVAHQLEAFGTIHFKKSWFDYGSELVIALLLALVIATVVRQTWFELYEIPTGSMRPTFEEQDHLTVSKLAFGINMPLQTKHLYFDPNLVQRTSVLIFSGDNIPIINSDSTYFWVFPYKKRYIKRCIGKPGDTLYFYGGKLYGVDSNGKLINELLNSPWMHGLEHVPFLSFEGHLTLQKSNTFVINQMNMPLGRIVVSPTGNLSGEIFNGTQWIKDQPTSKPHSTIQTYGDFWGIHNYAMARLLTKKQLQETGQDLKGLAEGVLYLELRHNPSLTSPAPRLIGDRRGYGIALQAYTSIIPLQQEHLDALMGHMYTARFVVKDGLAKRYSVEDQQEHGKPRFPGVPNGTYEFYYGKGVKVGWGGITSALAMDHPLYKHTPENVQKLYNLGIEVNTAYSPHTAHYSPFPSRYAYFRDGDLYLLGFPVIKKEDTALQTFRAREQAKEQLASPDHPYIAFKDSGPPLKQDGSIDIDFINTFGVKVPKGHYLVLGDNHAMSADSRVFGFVPQDNLQGAPSLIIWPPGDRIGRPMQKPYPIINVPRMIVWGIASLIAVIWYVVHRRNLRRPIFKPTQK